MKIRCIFKMSVEKAKNTLKELGFTDYETRVYIALVKAGPTTARDLSESSGVPHSRIYDVLTELENRGWVESQSGRPTRYRAKSPSEAVRLYRIKEEERLKEAGETLRQELEPIFEEEGGMEKPDIWTIRGKKEIWSRIEEMFGYADMEISCTLPDYSDDFLDFDEIFPILDSKEVDVKVLTSMEGEIVNELSSRDFVQVKCRSPLFGGGFIVDGKETLLVLESEGIIFGIWSEEIGLTMFAKEYFEYLWEDAGEV